MRTGPVRASRQACLLWPLLVLVAGLLAGCLATVPMGADLNKVVAPTPAPRSAVPPSVPITPVTRCDQPLGTLVLGGADAAAAAAMPQLQQLVQDSRCFTVVGPGPLLSALMRERQALASGPRESASAGSNLSKGQMLGADFVLQTTVRPEPSASGSSAANLKGLLPAPAGPAQASTEVGLTLVDVRSGVQVSAHEALAQGAAEAARAGASAVPFDPRTPEGRLLLDAWVDSYNQTVRDLQARRAATAVMGAVMGGALGGGVRSRSAAALPASKPAAQTPPRNTGPAAPSPAPVATAPDTSRHVHLDAPAVARPARVVAVEVRLSSDQPAPREVTVRPPPGQQLQADGRLPLPLPAGRSQWALDVVLSAPGFDPAGDSTNQATLVLQAGESAPVLFKLQARAGESGMRQLRATLWHEGAYLGSVQRDIVIQPLDDGVPGARDARSKAEMAGPAATPATPAAAGAPSLAADLQRSPHARSLAPQALAAGAVAGSAGARSSMPLLPLPPLTPDLTVHVRHEDPTRLGRAHFIIGSPHLKGLADVHFEYAPDAEAWLLNWMERLQRLQPGQGADAVARNVAELRGFGSALWERFTPPLLKQVLADLPPLRTVQVYSNNPLVPWELMRPGVVGPHALDFLGTSLRLARWHADGATRTHQRPLQQIPVREVVVIAPQYAGRERLPDQDAELGFLARLRGYRQTPANFDALRQLARQPPAGIVHFAGHGEMAGAGPAQRRFHLKLEDTRLDALTWRGLAEDAPAPRAPSLYFFNACDLGVAEAQAGTVSGWAPAVLDTGAGGFIGGLWPLNDRAASRFAMRFYGDLQNPGGRPLAVAGALQTARAEFFQTGDPTYLGYVYYGDVNLELAAGR